MKQFLISLSLLCSLASFSQSQNVTPPDTRTVTGCGYLSLTEASSAGLHVLRAPDEEVAFVYANGTYPNYCYTVIIECVGINSKKKDEVKKPTVTLK